MSIGGYFGKRNAGCALDNHLILEQLNNYEFHCTQDKRDLLAVMLFVEKAEGHLLQDNLFVMKYVRTSDQLADILTKGTFTTIQWQSLLQLWRVRQLFDSSDVHSFSHKPFLAPLSLCPRLWPKQ